jgi:hypothetical protein
MTCSSSRISHASVVCWARQLAIHPAREMDQQASDWHEAEQENELVEPIRTPSQFEKGEDECGEPGCQHDPSDANRAE